jgi:hypothetical protein
MQPKECVFYNFFRTLEKRIVESVLAVLDSSTATRQDGLNTVQQHDHLIDFAVGSVHFQRDIIVCYIGYGSFINATGHGLDVHRLTSESDQKIFDMLKVHLDSPRAGLL